MTRVEASSNSRDLSPKEEEKSTALHEGERAFNANDVSASFSGLPSLRGS